MAKIKLIGTNYFALYFVFRNFAPEGTKRMVAIFNIFLYHGTVVAKILFHRRLNKFILDSDWSNNCIDFATMCICVYTISSQKTLISNFEGGFG